MCVVQLSSLFPQKRIPAILDGSMCVLHLSDSKNVINGLFTLKDISLISGCVLLPNS